MNGGHEFGALEAFDRYRDLLDSSDAERIDPFIRTRLEISRGIPQERLAELKVARAALMADFVRELGDSTLISPAVALVAPLLAPLQTDPELFAQTNLAALAMTMPGSFLDTPAITLPSGKDAEGLPTSVQIARPSGDDDGLFVTALALEASMAGG